MKCIRFLSVIFMATRSLRLITIFDSNIKISRYRSESRLARATDTRRRFYRPRFVRYRLILHLSKDFIHSCPRFVIRPPGTLLLVRILRVSRGTPVKSISSDLYNSLLSEPIFIRKHSSRREASGNTSKFAFLTML